MSRTCLVTGGAGFIGCAVSGGLADAFDNVIAMDCLHPQIHAERIRPRDLDDRVDLRMLDVTKPEDWDTILGDTHPDVVLHLAAETGTGQSLREASRHAAVNVLGTTRMLDALVKHDALPEKIVLTSSRATYGEGCWQDGDGNRVYPGQRTHAMLEAQQWDFVGLTPLPQHSSEVRASPANVYAATKFCQENLVASWSDSFGVTPVLYRLQNVYGMGQSLTNPYTGIVSLFARLAKAGESIPVYEDGKIIRDFVYIDDVATALVAGVVRSNRAASPYDIGMGQKTTIVQIAEKIAQRYDAPPPHVTGEFRDGDVRAAWADISDSAKALQWQPTVSVEEGIERLCQWIDSRD
ncbi:NAD-dependent epimerase/dehydratase family protein [Actinomyces provencensis]|uniref:NAD-dependent epimerase/dehydratase family protein n=1 Tax=Actinomyces provencensis TaxID=1720198 RepID=UPI00096A38BE|nr:NAD-dependent epimerase/dehydratase family protein [Actinomyces provencensis]